jgi:glucan 1,3-beta-glucosidase
MLKTHWDSWVTEDDFRQISEAGLNHVRIPLGYWSVPLTKDDTNYTTSVKPYTPGAWPYFLKALNWARANDIHVIVDIHGAPGSQNGYDNSGQLTSNPQWANDPANVARTLDAIKFIVKNTGGLIDMIELLNEGAGFRGDTWAQTLQQFFKDGYDVVRDAVGDDMKVMIGDGFLTVEVNNDSERWVLSKHGADDGFASP